ncbi:Ribonuclease mar1 [Leptomonas seymouri]|uniref:Ribonuclease mar1 n=1 Tax=Leptomonas seymouri TaxID=5684 RepID=A0A0N1HWD2_LEPSE|nr:Ribonuclease mar1 [Leptomonas seymouri]|eukprot:KPI86352.1 Ribonuclease mar1 [Leptomonas seymouri]
MSRLLPHYSKGKTAFMCVDLQTAFSERIKNFSNCVFVANRLARMHEALPEHTKYIVTEQYPKGLGHTVKEITLPKTSHMIEKTRFSCVVPEVVELLKDVDNIVLFGIEGHVCVMQTAADLLDMNKRVVLTVDGLGSQKSTDFKAAMKLMGTWGPNCELTTSESLLLQMTKDAKDPNFKKIAKLLQDQSPIPL